MRPTWILYGSLFGSTIALPVHPGVNVPNSDPHSDPATLEQHVQQRHNAGTVPGVRNGFAPPLANSPSHPTEQHPAQHVQHNAVSHANDLLRCVQERGERYKCITVSKDQALSRVGAQEVQHNANHGHLPNRPQLVTNTFIPGKSTHAGLSESKAHAKKLPKTMNDHVTEWGKTLGASSAGTAFLSSVLHMIKHAVSSV